MKIDVPIIPPANFDHLDLDALKSAVWVYDVLNYRIHWANTAALKLWESEDLAELTARDFRPGSSAAVQQTLCSYLDEFERGRVIDRWWQISPNNIDKRVHCRFSGVLIPPGHMSMLVEGLHSELLQGNHSDYGAVMICLFDDSGAIKSANPPFEQQFGMSVPNLHSIVSEEFELAEILSIKNDVNQELLLVTQTGPRWHSVELRKHSDAELDHNSQASYSLTLLDIHDRKLVELKNAAAAETDALTGLYNRRGIIRKLTSRVDSGCTIFFIDLDDFKPINDTYGHAVGDEVLCQVAKVLRYEIHQAAICARLGGDEFILAIPGQQMGVEPAAVAKLIIQQLTKPFVASKQQRLQVTASVGSATIPGHAENIDTLLQKADAAMYLAKQRGRNRHVHYSDTVKNQLMRGQRILQQVDEQICAENSLFDYHAVVSTLTKKPFIFEARIHWAGQLLENLCSFEISEAIRKASHQDFVEQQLARIIAADLKQLRARYADSKSKISIGLPSGHYLDAGFFSRMAHCFSLFQMNKADVVFELSERALKRVIDQQEGLLVDASAKGFQFALTDFGSGCSPLISLSNLPLQYIKLSPEFSSQMHSKASILKFIIKLCKDLQLSCVATGVNDQALSDRWAECSVYLQQGLYLEAGDLHVSSDAEFV
ncbi:diguanylate cyclase [uncultured Pseudoteredinibacter sp.]|uniref:GGDEF domain-containing protein n=1 Tax=uncultured Pseudoteredinibacter sp. TaxID=1641701 RepID=UPI002634660E|nr:diguanylate cyclase [uncultured Pseudoteredinibacter sp.]